MLQYIFFIYNSTFKELSEESNDGNHCILLQNQKEYSLDRDISKKIYNSQNFGQVDAYVKTRAENVLITSETPVPLDFSFKAIDLTCDSEENMQNNTCIKSRAENVLNESETHVPLDFSYKAIDLTRELEDNSDNNTCVKTRTENNTCVPCHLEKNFTDVLNESVKLCTAGSL